MMTDEVVIVDGLIRTLDLVLKVGIDESDYFRAEEIKAKVALKAQNHFAVPFSEFGKTFSKAELLRSLFEVEEVLYVTIDNVQDRIRLEPNEIVQINNLVIQLERV